VADFFRSNLGSLGHASLREVARYAEAAVRTLIVKADERFAKTR
jgi:hypothetical protein